VPTILDGTAYGWWARRKGAFCPPYGSRFQAASFANTASRSRRRFCARFGLIVRPSKTRGRGECRVPNAPAASCALCSWSMHTSIHSGGTGNIRHSPRNGFTAYTCSPRGPGSFAPVASVGIASRENLTPASGRQDHTTSPSTSCAFVLRAISVHRIPRSTSVTIAKRPSVGRDDSLYSCFYLAAKLNSEIQKSIGRGFWGERSCWSPSSRWSTAASHQQTPVVMGPGVRRGDFRGQFCRKKAAGQYLSNGLISIR
jgi:hypothetical protein